MLLQLHIMAGMVGAFRFAPSSVCNSSQIPLDNVWTSRDLSEFQSAFCFMSAIPTNSVLHIVNRVCFVKCVNIATLIPYISAHQIITTCVIFAVENISARTSSYRNRRCTGLCRTLRIFCCGDVQSRYIRSRKNGQRRLRILLLPPRQSSAKSGSGIQWVTTSSTRLLYESSTL